MLKQEKVIDFLAMFGVGGPILWLFFELGANNILNNHSPLLISGAIVCAASLIWFGARMDYLRRIEKETPEGMEIDADA